MSQRRTALGAGAAGLLLGAASVPVAMAAFAPLGFLLLAALVGVATVRKELRALAGGLLVSFCFWWIYFIWRAVERCAALDRDPNGSCSISGSEEQLALAGAVALLGVLLIALARRDERARA